jgi:hypothetical protein
MSWDTWVMVADKLRNAGVEQIGMFYLGESFILPWLPDAINYARLIGFTNIFLTTNGSLSTPDVVKKCMDAGLNSLKFSINYSDPEQMTAIAKVKSRLYDTVDVNIIAARAVRDVGGYDCGLFGSYIAYDGDQGDRIKARVDSLTPYLDERPYALPLYSQAGQVTGSGPGNPSRVEGTRAPVPCWVAFAQAHVTHTGDLSACCFDHAGGFVVGSLIDGDFDQAWNSEAFRALRRAHLSGDVRGTVCDGCING